MVKYKLISDLDGILTYMYYPEGKEDKTPGKIVFDLFKNTSNIQVLAEEDMQRIITALEVNEFRESVNQSRIEDGEKPLTEEEWPIETEDFLETYYADHVISDFYEYYKNGEIPKSGMVAWY